MLANSDNDYITPKSPDDIIKFLCTPKNYRSVNFFYNLQYDVQGFLKFYKRDYLRLLYHLGRIKIGKNELALIPRKYFSIKKAGRVYKFYDLFQFFKSSLDEACQDYIDIGKEDIDHSLYNDPEYIEDNFPDIVQSCIEDCWLTRDLGEYLFDLYRKVQIPICKPFSVAYVGQKYFMRHCDIPVFYKQDWQRYAFLAYSGGRFEVFKRGYFDVISNLDINSAYPYEISQLIDIKNGLWVKKKTIPDEAYYGFIKCSIYTDQDFIAPLPFSYQGVIVYPKITHYLAYITLEEYKFLTDYNLADIEIIDGWFFLPNYIVRPFHKIKDMYAERLRLKAEGNDLEYILKIKMNSLYGKFLQLTPYLKQIHEPTYDTDVIDIITDDFSGTFKRYYRTGQIFCPIYAAIITANTRIKCHKLALQYKDDLVGIFTDGLLINDRVRKKSSKLGNWATKSTGKLVILGSGVYSMTNKNEIETRFRGFNTSKKLSIFELLHENADKTKIEIEFKRAVGLGEWLNHQMQYHENDLNRILLMNKDLHINFDTKRQWKRPFKNCQDVLESQITSNTLDF